jgi:hypothetical protein
MRLQLLVNSNVRCTASLAAPGYLNAHLNLAELPEKAESSRTVWIRGTQIDETENTSLRWPDIALDVGDTVELRVLADGESDSPSEVRKSSDAQSNLFSSSELAKELSQTVSNFDSRLIQILSKAEKAEPLQEYEKIRHAIARVIYGTGAELLYPIYRRHRELMPEELKGELL